MKFMMTAPVVLALPGAFVDQYISHRSHWTGGYAGLLYAAISIPASCWIARKISGRWWPIIELNDPDDIALT
jgi:hypothetical protein